MRFADQRSWSTGELLYAEGSRSEVMHVVVQGRASIQQRSPKINASAGPNRIVGGLSAFGSALHCYTATALEPTITLDIQKEDFFDVAEDHFGLGRAVFQAIGAERSRVNAEVARRQQSSTVSPE